MIGQAREHQPGTPAIAISSQDYDEHELRSAGFAAFLRRPVQQDALVTAILRAVNR